MYTDGIHIHLEQQRQPVVQPIFQPGGLISGVQIVKSYSDLLTSTAASVLVLANDKPEYGDGGPCWFETREGETKDGITRADGSVVFAAAGQGPIVPANADRESVMAVANTFIDNAALVYGSAGTDEGTLISKHCLPNADGTYNIACSSFVDAVLSKITFNNSRYVLGDGAENITGPYLGGNYLPTTTALPDAKPHSANTRELAQFFAQQKRLYVLPEDRKRALDLLEFGDILFNSAASASDSHFYRITHCMLVLGTYTTANQRRVVVAHATTSNAVSPHRTDFGAAGVKVSSISLALDPANGLNCLLFARPDYSRLPISAVDGAAAAAGAGTPYTFTAFLSPGLSLDNSGVNIISTQYYATSTEMIPVVFGTSLRYIGQNLTHEGMQLNVRAYWYDSNGQPLQSKAYDTINSSTGVKTVAVPGGAAFVRFRSGINTSTGGFLNWHDCIGCTVQVVPTASGALA